MDLGLFVLHFVIGSLLVGHGLQKLTGAFGGQGIEGTGQFMESLGLGPGRRNAIAAGYAETVGGGLIMLGFLTPIGAALVIAVMVTASLTAHTGKGLWAQDGGFELPLINATAAFALAAASPGAWSLDAAFGLALAGVDWAFWALAVGLLGGIGAVYFGRIEAERRERRPARQRPGRPGPATG